MHTTIHETHIAVLLRFVAARYRQQPGHARQVMVKGRVEACDLRQVQLHIHRHRVIWHGQLPGKFLRTFDCKRRARQADPLDTPVQHAAQRPARFKQREFDARRAAIDRQDAWAT
jgi:hypothetical protein